MKKITGVKSVGKSPVVSPLTAFPAAQAVVTLPALSDFDANVISVLASSSVEEEKRRKTEALKDRMRALKEKRNLLSPNNDSSTPSNIFHSSPPVSSQIQPASLFAPPHVATSGHVNTNLQLPPATVASSPNSSSVPPLIVKLVHDQSTHQSPYHLQSSLHASTSPSLFSNLLTSPPHSSLFAPPPITNHHASTTSTFTTTTASSFSPFTQPQPDAESKNASALSTTTKTNNLFSSAPQLGADPHQSSSAHHPPLLQRPAANREEYSPPPFAPFSTQKENVFPSASDQVTSGVSPQSQEGVPSPVASADKIQHAELAADLTSVSPPSKKRSRAIGASLNQRASCLAAHRSESAGPTNTLGKLSAKRLLVPTGVSQSQTETATMDTSSQRSSVLAFSTPYPQQAQATKNMTKSVFSRPMNSVFSSLKPPSSSLAGREKIDETCERSHVKGPSLFSTIDWRPVVLEQMQTSTNVASSGMQTDKKRERANDSSDDRPISERPQKRNILARLFGF
eukprot:GDKJ01021955.1.p1 GENE.GDKJ01021955.1~~GDKJ01021955.1.p1  ORF type:complete len:575 (-),score=184.40 GDKJ01021955.1:67-1599(-)